MKIYYSPKLKTLSRELRKKGILSEVLLWNMLKAKKMKGYQFMRQKPIDKYIVDFYCNKLKLVIEIDGGSHDQKSEEDEIRQRNLESLGLTILRFYDMDVKKNMNGVLERVQNWIEECEKRRQSNLHG